MSDIEPNLGTAALYDILVILCEENGKRFDDLDPAVFGPAREQLTDLAKVVRDSPSRHRSVDL